MSTTILSHNIYWFQGQPFDGGDPDGANPAIAPALADVWQHRAPDVICLQEVPDRNAFDQARTELSLRNMPATGTYRPGSLYPQYGGALFYQNGHVVADSSNSLADVHRVWQAVQIETTDRNRLLIVNVHLPSKRKLGQEEAAKRRVLELERMLDIVGDADVVAGDLNEQVGGGVNEILESRGFHDAAVVSGQGDLPSSLSGRRGDYIWLNDRASDKLVGFGNIPADGITSVEPGIEHLSDHLPLWAVIDL
jgi:endonuclease/exonuclease/phosphatase family metal-dependent hydrolase